MKTKSAVLKTIFSTLLVSTLCPLSFYAQKTLSCPYTISNYTNRVICFDYEVRCSKGSGGDCATLHKGTACLQKAENDNPSHWQLDSTFCKDAEDIVIEVKSCGGCTLIPKLICANHCEGSPKASGSAICCRSIHIEWDWTNTKIY